MTTVYKQKSLDVPKTQVFLRVVFLKIGEINTLKEKYAADVFLQARWQLPPGHQKPTRLTDYNKDSVWNPQLIIENVLGDSREDIWRYAEPSADGKLSIYECRRVKGVFIENLELQHFPFDTQELSLTISSELSELEVELLEEAEELSSVNKQSFVDEQEWRLYEHVEMFPKISTKEYTSSKDRHPVMLVMCHAARRPGFFIWNIFLIMMLITLLSFATFAVEIFLTQNRLQLSFTLMLTGVAFKFVVNQSLPRISYLTYLDKYILSSMVYICLVCIWHSVIGQLHANNMDSMAKNLDWKALVCFVSAYILAHFVFTTWIYKNSWSRRKLMNRKDDLFKEKLEAIIRETNKKDTAFKKRRQSIWKPASSVKKSWDPV
ncbi:hypothetical protein LOTGIDRAFT_162572 [Lottia gigantea]|uniref:Neurotransmitter-gated ion-channel ligand-binding domain-containing protein n=1 Tax=Lottia gigantea TaxID=225164 RepID=V4AGW4_LOTGI|nr:hypothetical protein LOTGIDRAFT_162572 [Lottia gigantea]ESO92651.1 hypothetical protein LOTGIDRAFT_162572 [Lottia gigantea]